MLNEETKKFAADITIKKALQGQAFKWKSLVNDPKSGKRSQLMELKKPASAPPFENTRNLEPGQEPITKGVCFGCAHGDSSSSTAIGQAVQTAQVVSTVSSPPAWDVRRTFLSNFPTLVFGTSSMKAHFSGTHQRATLPSR